MISLAHREDCCGCGACAAACPHAAIRMEADDMGFRYPKVDPSLCINCGLCEEICAFKPLPADKEPRAEAIRFPSLMDRSQSGGLAAALMRKAIAGGTLGTVKELGLFATTVLTPDNVLTVVGNNKAKKAADKASKAAEKKAPAWHKHNCLIPFNELANSEATRGTIKYDAMKLMYLCIKKEEV